jgi:hypothetical protein
MIDQKCKEAFPSPSIEGLGGDGSDVLELLEVLVSEVLGGAAEGWQVKDQKCIEAYTSLSIEGAGRCLIIRARRYRRRAGSCCIRSASRGRGRFGGDRSEVLGCVVVEGLGKCWIRSAKILHNTFILPYSST